MQEKRNYLKTLIFFAVATALALDAEWSYENMDSWSEDFPDCGGKMQSPINLSTSAPPTRLKEVLKNALHNLIARNHAPSLKLSNYKSFLSGAVKLSNNGHTLVVEPADGAAPSNALIRVANNHRSFKYSPASLHFHWGAPDKPGSEHLINNIQYDAELHIVHKNTDANAEAKYEFAVLGIMLQVVDEPEKDFPALNKILDKLPLLEQYKSEASIDDGLNLEKLLLSLNIESYYSYRGSLTTPPCTEAVTWFVLTDVLQVSKSEMQKFFTLEDSHNHALLSNFRPVQPLGNRTIFYSKEFSNDS